MPGRTLTGIEIFRAGTWNGDRYTTADLDALVAAYEAVGFTPPLTLGHTEDGGAPAVGWVSRLWRDGEVLRADVSDIPESLYAVIERRGYDTVSCEILFDHARNGVTYPRVLTAVALLGAKVPAVDLAPISAALAPRFAAAPAGTPHRYTLPKEGGMDPVTQKALDDLKAQVATLAAENRSLQDKVKLLSGTVDAEKLVQLSVENTHLRATQSQTQAALDAERAAHRAADAQARADRVVVPALRPTVKALYDLALAAPKAVQYQAEPTGPAIATPADTVVDALVDLLNGPAGKLLATFSQTGGAATGATGQDAGEALAAKAKAYAAAHKVPFDQALTAVRTDPANAALVAAYATSGR